MTERPILFSAPMVRAILDGRKTQTRRVVKHQRETPPNWATFAQELSNLSWNAAPRKNGLFQWGCAEDEGVRTIRRWPENENGHYAIPCPYGKPGDRLWVRETFSVYSVDPGTACLTYKERMPAGKTLAETDGGLDVISLESEDWDKAYMMVDTERWRPSIHMPRWASRMTLEITDVRVQRLQEISEDDAIAEGVEKLGEFPNITPWRNYRFQQPAGAHNFSTARASFMSLWMDINGADSYYANPWVWAITFKVVKP